MSQIWKAIQVRFLNTDKRVEMMSPYILTSRAQMISRSQIFLFIDLATLMTMRMIMIEITEETEIETRKKKKKANVIVKIWI